MKREKEKEEEGGCHCRCGQKGLKVVFFKEKQKLEWREEGRRKKVENDRKTARKRDEEWDRNIKRKEDTR